MSVTQRGKGRALLSVTPDQAWLTDPARTFPVTVDPTYASATLSSNFDTFVQSGITSDQSSSVELRAGTFDGGTTVARSYINFPLSGIKGVKVESAYLWLANNYSYSCTARQLNAYQANPASTSTRWTLQPTTSTTVAGSVSTAKGYSTSCPAARVAIPVTSTVQGFTVTTATTYALSVRAGSETDSYGWKKFGSNESNSPPYISYTYDRKPNASAAPVMANAATFGGSSYVAYGSTTVRSKATDPDGNKVQLTYEVHTDTTGSTASKIASCVTAFVASGTNAECTPSPGLPDNQTLYVRAAVMDDQNGGMAPGRAGRRSRRR